MEEEKKLNEIHRGEEVEGKKEAEKQEQLSSLLPQIDIEEELEKTKKTLEETHNKMLRIAADFENYKKRIEKEKIEYIKFANEKLLRELLPVLDNIERAIKFSKENSENIEAIKSGIELIAAEFKRVLEKFGVESFDAKNKKFDPFLHSAVQKIETDEYEEGYIIDVLQTGYLYNHRLLRPAHVIVAKKPVSKTSDIKIEVETEEKKESN